MPILLDLLMTSKYNTKTKEVYAEIGDLEDAKLDKAPRDAAAAYNH
jgi:hypothetical protein